MFSEIGNFSKWGCDMIASSVDDVPYCCMCCVVRRNILFYHKFMLICFNEY